ncbi:MAG: pyruvate formate lyase family protein [Anaerolineae bacterium]
METVVELDTQTALRSNRADQLAALITTAVECTPVEIPSGGLLAGPLHVNMAEAARKLGYPWEWSADNLHFALNVHTLLKLGLPGIIQQAEQRASELGGERAHYLQAIARCYTAVQGYVLAHATHARCLAANAEIGEQARFAHIAVVCQACAERAPESFHEALQLFWFVYVLRNQGTVGRLDQHLYPFYRHDLLAGTLDRAQALGMLCELWQRMNQASIGDTLRNVMLGGQDASGADATNDLSYLMLDASIAICQPEPHINARIHKNTPPSFLDKVAELQLLGHGQGALYNDEVFIPALVRNGVPLPLARNYANDGCSEVTIDGESTIKFVVLDAVKALELTLFNGEENVLPGEAQGRYTLQRGPLRTLKTGLKFGYRSGDFTTMSSYEQVYSAYIDQYLYQAGLLADYLCHSIQMAQSNEVTSPLTAGTFASVLETGIDPFRGGVAVPCYMIFSGSLATVADSLAAIKQVVYEQRASTPSELLQALRADWVGHDVLRQQCLMAPKFGNDDDRVDGIAADIAHRFCDFVAAYPSPTGAPFWPALFNFLFNDHAKVVGATPDGRRWQDPIGEHYSPTPGRARQGPTAVIRSAAKGPHYLACGTSVLNLSLNRTLVPNNDEGRLLVRQLCQTALGLGLGVLSTSIYDVAALRQAQREPEQFRDLIVRVWGFSARFVELSTDMQEHIIARAIGGR